MYLNPLALKVVPVSAPVFMRTVGVVEMIVGLAILAGWTRLGAYAASGWLLAVAANLVAAGFYDIAVRDVVMSLAAFTLARLAEVREVAPTYGFDRVVEGSRREIRA